MDTLEALPGLKKSWKLVPVCVDLFRWHYCVGKLQIYPGIVREEGPGSITGTLLGCYTPYGIIRIWFDELESGNDLLFAVNHELRHWWQHKVEGTAFYNVQEDQWYYKGNPISYDYNNLSKFNRQPIEDDANESALLLVKEFHAIRSQDTSNND